MARGRGKGRKKGGLSNVAIGVIALVLIVIGVYFGFTKHIPFTHDFRLKAVVSSAVSIRKNSPVRIAGVNVGTVKGVSRYKDTDLSEVKMELSDQALPIHADAQLKIRPRIFLEGNFFVQLDPGTPGSPVLHDGDTIPITQTSVPVQLDEVLTALQSNTRADLQTVLQQYGRALQAPAPKVETLPQDPQTRYLTGARALHTSLKYGGDAFKYSSQVNEALLGLEPHDVSKLIKAGAKISNALDSRERVLQDLLVNFNRATGATAAEHVALQQTLRLLPPTLTVADRTFADLNAAFPPTREFARAILPGVRETGPTIDAAFPWVEQAQLLVGPTELRGLARELQPTTADLARLTNSTLTFLPRIDLVNRCVKNIVLPTGDVQIQDGASTVPVPNYKEFWYAMVGLAGEGQNFDGNGQYVRFQPGGGDQTVSLGASSLTGDKVFGNAAAKPLGTRPAFPGKRSPYNPTFPCYRNARPNLNGPAANPGPADPSSVAPGSSGSGGGLPLPLHPSHSARSRGKAKSSDRSGGATAPSLTDRLLETLNPVPKAVRP